MTESATLPTDTAAKSTIKKLGMMRPTVSATGLTLASATFILAAYNALMWANAVVIFDSKPVLMILYGVAIWALTVLTITFFGFRWLLKPALAVLLIICAVASYYQDNLGVLIDRDMIRNAMITTANESKHLMTPRFIYTTAIWGVLPALLVFWVRIKPTPILRNLLTWGITCVASFALLLGALFIDFKAISATFREHNELVGSYQPGATIAALNKYARQELRGRNVVVAPLGRDAHKGPFLAAAKKPVLMVLFMGETARAQNWGLNGYTRDTTPELRQRGVINYTDVSTCGTSTAVSLPCMYSNLTKAGYSHQGQLAQENLFDVLNHAKLHPTWLDNQTGDQNIGKRIGFKTLTVESDPAACPRGECTDAVFLPKIKAAMDTITEDTVLVLHMIGNHGPAYYMRYPEGFGAFKPACQTAEFAECTTQEIVNAYDNALMFTDHVLASTIDMMKAQDRVIPAMFYVSDHGESLGENGLYLHAAPSFMAPDVQTHVPMVMWMSDAYQQTLGLDATCIAKRSHEAISHDVYFHTVLGLLNVVTSVYSPALDLTAGCRRP